MPADLVQRCVSPIFTIFLSGAGRSVRAIAKARGCSVEQINEAIDRWAVSAIDDRTRRHTLTLERARLDELQETF